MNAFNAYCRRATTNDKPAQDFLIDFNSDHRSPQTITAWDQLHVFLLCHDACPEAVQAAKVVWRNYAAQQRRRRTKRRTKT